MKFLCKLRIHSWYETQDELRRSLDTGLIAFKTMRCRRCGKKKKIIIW